MFVAHYYLTTFKTSFKFLIALPVCWGFGIALRVHAEFSWPELVLFNKVAIRILKLNWVTSRFSWTHALTRSFYRFFVIKRDLTTCKLLLHRHMVLDQRHRPYTCRVFADMLLLLHSWYSGLYWEKLAASLTLGGSKTWNAIIVLHGIKFIRMCMRAHRGQFTLMQSMLTIFDTAFVPF